VWNKKLDETKESREKIDEARAATGEAVKAFAEAESMDKESIAAAVKKIIATRTPFATDADQSRVFMAMMGDAFIKARVDNAEIANFRLGSQQRVGITKASPGQVLQCLVAVPVNEKGVHLTPVDMDGYGSGFCMICTGDLSPVHLAPYDERKADATRKPNTKQGLVSLKPSKTLRHFNGHKCVSDAVEDSLKSERSKPSKSGNLMEQLKPHATRLNSTTQRLSRLPANCEKLSDEEKSRNLEEHNRILEDMVLFGGLPRNALNLQSKKGQWLYKLISFHQRPGMHFQQYPIDDWNTRLRGRVDMYYKEIQRHVEAAAAKQCGFAFGAMEHDGWDSKAEGPWKGQKFVAVTLTIPW